MYRVPYFLPFCLSGLYDLCSFAHPAVLCLAVQHTAAYFREFSAVLLPSQNLLCGHRGAAAPAGLFYRAVLIGNGLLRI